MTCNIKLFGSFYVATLVCCILPTDATSAEVLSLDDALRTTYTACVGIDAQLSELKKMAGINTAVTGVGTAVGAGATVVGLVKASKDKQIANLEEKLAKLKELTARQTITAPNRAELLSEN